MIGILGGLGPQAAGEFFSRLVDRFAEEGFVPNPHIILNCIPDPGVNTLEEGQNFNLEPFLKGIRFLIQNSSRLIVMACNTIHIHLQKLRQLTGFQNILSIQDAVKIKILPLLGKDKKFCFLSTYLTSKHGLYNFGEEYANSLIKLTSREQFDLDELINNYKMTSNHKCFSEMDQIIQSVINRVSGEEIIFVPACTEISVLAAPLNVHKIDTMDALIDHAVNSYRLFLKET